MAALHGAPTILPSFVTRMVEHIMRATGANSDGVRNSWIKKLTPIIAKHVPDALYTAVAFTATRPKQYEADDSTSSALIIAIRLRDTALVTQLLAFGANPWIDSGVFKENAFKLATQLKDTQLVRTLLSSA